MKLLGPGETQEYENDTILFPVFHFSVPEKKRKLNSQWSQKEMHGTAPRGRG